ncbi:MAG: hypothetical protein DYH18_00770 [Xanthomonadales bacterium PRO7]|nr:hypothetical protein [Xanthomonadales bacterium PRO7]
MMRIVIAVLLSLAMSSCSSKSFNPVARFDIRASDVDQAKVIETMKKFAGREGFKIFARDDMPKQGRFVSQLDLRRADGVAVSTSNFMKADTLQTFFYAEKPGADWQPVKVALQREIAAALGGRGKIVEVPVKSAPARSSPSTVLATFRFRITDGQQSSLSAALKAFANANGFKMRNFPNKTGNGFTAEMSRQGLQVIIADPLEPEIFDIWVDENGNEAVSATTIEALSRSLKSALAQVPGYAELPDRNP